MLFPTTAYVVFLALVCAGYWTLCRVAGDRARLAWLAVASLAFYMTWEPVWVVLILGSTALDFTVGRRLGLEEDPRRRRLWLALSLTGNLGLLGIFKYAAFFSETVGCVLGWLGFDTGAGPRAPVLELALPLGISFYTFQTLSYTLDVYRGLLEPTRSPLCFAVFVSFFPQLIAGPIVRARQFLPQLARRPRLDEQAAQRGLFRIAVGATKKIALADVIASGLVDPVFADPQAFSPLVIVLALYGALLQFYLDISGYADMAIGSAACLGLSIPENFDRPYLSQSVGEFWRRWHITVSTWFRDYVMRPLGFARPRSWRALRNLTITTFLLGLWHGPGWNYILWGLLNGWATFVEMAVGRARKSSAPTRLGRVLRRALVFHWLALTMLFFRNGTHLDGGPGWAGSRSMLAALFDFQPRARAIDPSAAVHLPEQGGAALLALGVAMLLHFTPPTWGTLARERWTRWPSSAQGASLVAIAALLSVTIGDRHVYLYFQF